MKTIKLMVVMITFILANIQSVHAKPAMMLSDGFTTIKIFDESPEDALLGIEGGVGYIGSVGLFNINVTTGFSTPLLGTSEFPILNLNSVGVSSSGKGGTLTLMLTDTGFGPIASPVFQTTVGGTNRGTASFNTYVDSTNTEFGTETLIGSLGTYSSGAFSGSTSAIYSPSDLFSITSVATITHGSGTKASSFGLNVNVAPEPISSVLFVLGGVVLCGRSYFKRNK